MLEILIDAGARIDKKGFFGRTALIDACMFGNYQAAEYLIKRGASVNMEDDIGRTALFYASMDGHTTIITLLCANKAKINASDKNGYTPLIAACEMNQLDSVELLITLGADVHAVTRGSQTALTICAAVGHDHISKVLTSGRFKYDQYTIDLALCLAISSGNTSIAENMIGLGADINAALDENFRVKYRIETINLFEEYKHKLTEENLVKYKKVRLGALLH